VSSKWLTIVDLDGVKTGEEIASDRQYPREVIGKFCVARRSSQALGFPALGARHLCRSTRGDCYCCTS
jgi:hypothetical protein